MIFMLLGGIVVAAGVFAALIWSIYQGLVQRGRLQYVHIAAASFSIAGMVSVSYISPLWAQITGGALLLAALIALFLETHWNRFLPIMQTLFAIALILGLPFKG